MPWFSQERTPSKRVLRASAPGAVVEAAVGQPSSWWCQNQGSNLPWKGFADAYYGGFTFNNATVPCSGTTPAGLTNYSTNKGWGNQLSSVQNLSNRALYLYTGQSGSGTQFTIMPGSNEPNLDSMGGGVKNFNDVTQSSQIDTNPFTCATLLSTTNNSTNNFWSSNFGGPAAQTALMSSVTDTPTGWTCLNRTRLQSCLNGRASGQLLDPSGTFYSKLLNPNADIISGYNYDNSQADANACNLLIQQYCATGANMAGPVCQSILTDQSDTNFNGPNILSGVLANYCSSNLTSSECMTYCGSKSVNCDSIMTTFCGKYTAAQIAASPSLLSACGGVMNLNDPTFYSRQCTSLSAQFPALSTVCGRPECWYPAAQNGLKTWAVKNGSACPSLTACISDLQIDAGGQVQVGSLQFTNSQQCSSYAGGGGASGAGAGGSSVSNVSGGGTGAVSGGGDSSVSNVSGGGTGATTGGTGATTGGMLVSGLVGLSATDKWLIVASAVVLVVLFMLLLVYLVRKKKPAPAPVPLMQVVTPRLPPPTPPMHPVATQPAQQLPQPTTH